MSPQPAEAALAVAGQELSALADNLPNPAWIAYADGSIFWYNRAWYDYTGATPEEMLGWGWSKVHHPDELERVTAEWVAALGTGNTVELTFPLRRHDGVFRPFLTRAVPIRDSGGDIIRWFGTNVDISDQVEAEERARRAEADWRRLFDEMHEGIAVMDLLRDRDGRVIDSVFHLCNARFEEVTGVDRNRAVGTSVSVIAGDRADDLVARHARVAATGVSETYAGRIASFGRSFAARIYRHDDDQVIVLLLDMSAIETAERQAAEAEGNWRALFDEMQEGMSVIELVRNERGEAIDAVVRQANRQFEVQMGLPAVDSIGKPISMRSRVGLARRLAIYEEILATGRSHTFETGPDELGRLFQISAYRFSATQLATLFNDITARKQAEDQAARAVADWRMLFDEMQEAFAVGRIERDSAGRPVDTIIDTANSRWEQMTGLPNDSAAGTRGSQALGETAGFFLDTFSAVVDSGEPVRFEQHIPAIDRWLEVRAYRHRDDQFAAVFLDVTDRKQAEQAARRAQENLMRVSRLSAMGAMASTLSHELNQPIGAASNFIAAADQHVQRAATLDPALLRRLFDSAIASCQRAGNIIRSMRAFTASGTVTRRAEPLSELIDASIEDFTSGASAAAIRFVVDCPAGRTPVQCDRIQIIQVLSNLYTNSARAMAGQADPRITVAADSTDCLARIRVADNGPGFGDRSPDELFEPFWSTTDVGLGLGLPLCRTIVEAHGGTIRAEPADAGAAFLIELPLVAQTLT